jgi:hypothetical protein
MRGRFLYEIRPDVFPEGWLTDVELTLWGLYYEERNRSKARG